MFAFIHHLVINSPHHTNTHVLYPVSSNSYNHQAANHPST